MTPQENPPPVATPVAAAAAEEQDGTGSGDGPAIRSRSTWHAMGVDDVVVHLASHEQLGLTGEEAARRLAQYGRNELQERPRPSFLQLVLAQLNNFVIILLIVAAVISALLGDWVEAGAILLIVVLNAVLGVVQESRAEQALAALKKMASPEAHVLRDGVHRSVPASELVPGDLVLLEAGNFVPADLRLLEAVNLRVEEAALTGESEAVEKSAALVLDADATLGDRKNTAFMGTIVAYGRGRGLVVATGMHTQLGLIADMLQNVEQEETPLQQRLDELGKVLGWGALAICGIVFLVGIVRSGLFTQPFTAATTDALVESFMIAVSLAIAAVPEGLPAVVTISLALGMREMVRRHALIRKLASVETLGSATVICSDKTGTLTQNVMTVTRMWVDGRFVDLPPAAEPGGEFLIQGQPVSLRSYPGVATALWVGVLNNDAQLEKIDSEAHADDAAVRLPRHRRPQPPPSATASSAILPRAASCWRPPAPGCCRTPSTRPIRASRRSRLTRRASAWSPCTTSRRLTPPTARRCTTTCTAAGAPSPSRVRPTSCCACARASRRWTTRCGCWTSACARRSWRPTTA